MEETNHDEEQELPVAPFIMRMTDVYLCAVGQIPYDAKVKASAIALSEWGGRKDIFIQVLANGNLEFPDDVAAEAMTHYIKQRKQEAGYVPI